jgi:hypothetical protein
MMMKAEAGQMKERRSKRIKMKKKTTFEKPSFSLLSFIQSQTLLLL